MPSFQEHLTQVGSNLEFLKLANHHSGNQYYDWQVTICFYVAVHLVNAHLANFGSSYRSHTDVNDALNPEHTLSLTKIDEGAYLAYMKLFYLSRRARYLVHEDAKNKNTPNSCLTYDKHLAKAIRNLDKIMKYFADKYRIAFSAIPIKCPDINNSEVLHYFQKK